ncbi:MAG: CRISPR-associated endonuclease Cas2 [Candidatus Omnitrophica bacterium]|nr:CRISPR-associated endonuclease Cas2 [Candidatus Omnitrophota bacterium]
MMVLVSYDVRTSDIGGQKRLRHVAKACKNYGQRVQFSVFECIIDPAQWMLLKSALLRAIDPEVDSLRFYFMGSNWQHKVEHVGAKEVVDLEGPLIV